MTAHLRPRNPFETLKDDLVLRIFRNLLDIAVTLPFQRNDAYLVCPLISRTWRRILLAEHSLWAQIILLNRSFSDPNKFLDSFNTIVGRSRHLPLIFSIVLDSFPHERYYSSTTQQRDTVYGEGRIGVFEDIICPHIDRVRDVACFVSSSRNSGFLLNIPREIFENAEVIDSDTVNSNQPFLINHIEKYQNPSYLDSFQAHTLRIVIMGGVNLGNVKFQANYLTRLNFQNKPLRPHVVKKIMDRSRRSLVEAFLLVRFDTETETFISMQRSYRTPIIMTALTTLHIRLVDVDYYSSFMQHFRFPTLYDFRVEHIDMNLKNEWDIPLYTSVLSHSSSSLQHLVLSRCPDPVGLNLQHRYGRPTFKQIKALLEVLPNLQGLRFPLDIPLRRKILRRISDAELLPEIEVLEFSTDDDPDHAMNMIQNRNGSALKSRIEMIILTVSWTYLPKQIRLMERVRSLDLRGGCEIRIA